MGAVCCSFIERDDSREATLTSLDDRLHRPNRHPTSATALPVFRGQPRRLFEFIPPQEIEEGLRLAQGSLDAPAITQPANLFIDEKLRLVPGFLRLWVHFSDLESGNKLHQYFQELSLPFTPEFILLFNLNLGQAEVRRIDENTEQFEVLAFDARENQLALVSQTKTKSILVIPPNNFLTARVVRRLENGDILQYQRSVELTGLRSDPELEAGRARLKNRGTMHLQAERLQARDGQTLAQTYTKVDILSSVTLKLLQSLIKSRAKNFNDNAIALMIEFLVRTDNFETLRWFDVPDKEAQIRQIFQTNLQLAKSAELNLPLLDPSVAALFHEKTRKPREEALDQQDEEDRFEEDREGTRLAKGDPLFTAPEVGEKVKNQKPEEAPENGKLAMTTPTELGISKMTMVFESPNSQSDESSRALPSEPDLEIAPLETHLSTVDGPQHLSDAHYKNKRKRRKR